MNTLPTVTSDHKLPSHSELFDNDDVAFKHNKLLATLNKPVHTQWLKKHDSVTIKGQPYWYLPIDKVKFLLTRIFGVFHNYEILRYSTELNSFVAVVRLNYCIPGTNIWLSQDGIGAVPVQVQKGQSAANLAAILSTAGQKGLPAAVSFAVSNAAEQLGKIFGKDLNKQDAMPYMGLNEDLHSNSQPEATKVEQQTAVVQPQPAQQQTVQQQNPVPPVYVPPSQPDYNRQQFGAQPYPPQAPTGANPQPVQPPTGMMPQSTVKQSPIVQQTPANPYINNFNPNDL